MLLEIADRRTEPSMRAQAGAQACAIAHVPEPGSALDQFARAWLGRDAAEAGPRPAALYGLVAPPFLLGRGARRADLLDALGRFAARRRPVALGQLRLEAVHEALALVPETGVAAARRLHAQCLFAFESFRLGPAMDPAAAAGDRRLPSHQRLLAALWGHPEVLGEFRFSIPLTGPLPRREIERLAPALAPALRDVREEPLAVRSLSLLGMDDAGRSWRPVARFALGG